MWTIPYAGSEVRAVANFGATSTAWPAANRAIYCPIWLPWPYLVRRLWWVNGSAAGGNWDIGIFSVAGTRLLSSGSVAGSGNSAPQFDSGYDFLLPPGRYFLGLAHDSTTANRVTGHGSVGPGGLRLGGLLQQDNAFPLPASMNPSAITATFMPIAGMTRTPSGF